MNEEGKRGKYVNEGVEVSIFNNSIDDFFSDMDYISNLCSSSSKPELDFADLDRFSSMITFLNEWKYFQYEPRNVSFPCEGEKGVADANADPVRRELNLPQFSSAAVPKATRFAGETDSSSSDFVLYAGGSVWALDWCPRANDKLDSAITCEYLAVSAHPPGCNYNKMGASLKGRGAIQIWCLITTTETIELSKPRYEKHVAKGRPKKTLIVKDGVENDQNSLSATKHRGRPNKALIVKDGIENDQKSITAIKRRGRPKKALIVKDGVENDQRSPTAPKRRGRPKKVLIGKDGIENDQTSLTAARRRGRPKKELLTGPTSMNQVAKPKKRPINEEDACAIVPKRRGRPRKYGVCSTSEKVDQLLLPVTFDLEGATPLLALPPPPDANSTEEGSKRRGKIGNSQSQEVSPLASGAALHAGTDKDLRCLEMTQEGHNIVTNKEANLPPVVEPLDIALSVLYGKKRNKRRLKDKRLVKKPDIFVEGNNIIRDDVLTDCQMVQQNSTETECNAKAMASALCYPKEPLLPKLVFCLAHYGKVAWDIKWKPLVPSSSAHMGYLALLLGNGSLEVWEVPVPSTVQRLYSSNPGLGEGTDPRFLKLKPVFRCSKLVFGNRQSIPLTLEWSPSPPSDMILAGCHDGTVALWKFAIHTSCEDSRPLLVFTADSAPIRSLSWAPYDCDDTENANLFVTAGAEGLKFWDIRDPYRSLWEVNPAHRAVVSVDWLKDPRCVLMSFEDGTMRIFSLPKGVYDLPATGVPLPRKQFEGLFSYTMSLFAIWSIHTSPTGLVAYCVTDGSVVLFQLTERFLEADPTRNRTPYFLCDSFKEEGGTLELGAPFRSSIIPNLPLKPIKGPNRYITGNDRSLVSLTNPPEKKDEENKAKVGTAHEGDDGCEDAFPSKLAALHKVRWNKNKGTERWLCYGGAAGIIRLQKISLDS